ncbi:transposase [Nocardia sp. NPDC101769]|uniref:transposase n=1 Tax=Nocardia sp. NPDC101769 TaxID=3364333 RepID=UPI003813D7A7
MGCRQYSGTAGRVEDRQLGLFCAYTSVKGRTLIDRELYLPKSWTADRDRCREAGVPDEVDFATKQVLAQRMLARALDAGAPARWVTAGEAYGGDSKLRRWLERRRIGYVVAAPSSAPIVSLSGKPARRPGRRGTRHPRHGSGAAGAKGERPAPVRPGRGNTAHRR